jgi:hypothetical protein
MTQKAGARGFRPLSYRTFSIRCYFLEDLAGITSFVFEDVVCRDGLPSGLSDPGRALYSHLEDTIRMAGLEVRILSPLGIKDMPFFRTLDVGIRFLRPRGQSCIYRASR